MINPFRPSCNSRQVIRLDATVRRDLANAVRRGIVSHSLRNRTQSSACDSQDGYGIQTRTNLFRSLALDRATLHYKLPLRHRTDVSYTHDNEDWYGLTDSENRSFAIKKLQDARGGDLDLLDTVGAIFEDETDLQMRCIRVIQAPIDREMSLPPTSNLRPVSSQKRILAQAGRNSTKRQRIDAQDEERMHEYAHPDQAILSLELPRRTSAGLSQPNNIIPRLPHGIRRSNNIRDGSYQASRFSAPPMQEAIGTFYKQRNGLLEIPEGYTHQMTLGARLQPSVLENSNPRHEEARNDISFENSDGQSGYGTGMTSIESPAEKDRLNPSIGTDLTGAGTDHETLNSLHCSTSNNENPGETSEHMLRNQELFSSETNINIHQTQPHLDDLQHHGSVDRTGGGFSRHGSGLGHNGQRDKHEVGEDPPPTTASQQPKSQTVNPTNEDSEAGAHGQIDAIMHTEEPQESVVNESRAPVHQATRASPQVTQAKPDNTRNATTEEPSDDESGDEESDNEEDGGQERKVIGGEENEDEEMESEKDDDSDGIQKDINITEGENVEQHDDINNGQDATGEEPMSSPQTRNVDNPSGNSVSNHDMLPQSADASGQDHEPTDAPIDSARVEHNQPEAHQSAGPESEETSQEEDSEDEDSEEDSDKERDANALTEGHQVEASSQGKLETVPREGSVTNTHNDEDDESSSADEDDSDDQDDREKTNASMEAPNEATHKEINQGSSEENSRRKSAEYSIGANENGIREHDKNKVTELPDRVSSAGNDSHGEQVNRRVNGNTEAPEPDDAGITNGATHEMTAEENKTGSAADEEDGNNATKRQPAGRSTPLESVAGKHEASRNSDLVEDVKPSEGEEDESEEESGEESQEESENESEAESKDESEDESNEDSGEETKEVDQNQTGPRWKDDESDESTDELDDKGEDQSQWSAKQPSQPQMKPSAKSITTTNVGKFTSTPPTTPGATPSQRGSVRRFPSLAEIKAEQEASSQLRQSQVRLATSGINGKEEDSDSEDSSSESDSDDDDDDDDDDRPRRKTKNSRFDALTKFSKKLSSQRRQ